MFDRYRRTVEEKQELSLLPVMNLFVVLIPFLLMGATFFHVGAIPAALPRITPETSNSPKEPITVAMHLVIAPEFLELSAESDHLAPDQLQELRLKLPNEDDGYDVASLREHLQHVKESYPKSTTLVVAPHDLLDYETLVTLLDACRTYPAGPGPQGQRQATELFPVVAFSRIPRDQRADRGVETPGEPQEPTAGALQ